MKSTTSPTRTLTTGPLTPSTLGLLQATRNEWLDGLTLDAMHDAALDTLAWLYIHSTPAGTVELSIRAEAFLRDVLEFGETVSLSELAAAGREIQKLVAALEVASK